MSSDFAEFLFSFACNKLESSPQLDLRQQLLHSNLIRHILLVHQSGSSSSSTSSPSSPSSLSASSLPSDEQPQLLSLPPLPPSPPLSPSPQHSHQPLHFVYPSSSASSYDHPAFQPFPAPSLVAVAPSHWSPFSFDDELDRIRHNNDPDQIQVHDLDVDMGEELSDHDSLPSSLYINDLNGSNNTYDYCFGFRPSYVGPQLQEEDDDLDYDYESSQAQEDWLDAVFEDLMEEDDHDDSSVEYDSEDDCSDSFGDDGENIKVTRGAATVVVAVGSTNENGEDVVLGHPQGRHLHLPQPHLAHSSAPAPLSNPSQKPLDFSHPFQQSYLHQSFPSKEKGSTTKPTTTTTTTNITTSATSSTTTAASETTAAATSRLLSAERADIDEPMNPHNHHVSPLKLQQELQLQQSYYIDDAYYRSCPPCLGFHTSSRSSSQREEDLREQRFVQLRQELGSTLIQGQESALVTGPLLPEQQSLEDSLRFRLSALSQSSRQYPFVALGH